MDTQAVHPGGWPLCLRNSHPILDQIQGSEESSPILDAQLPRSNRTDIVRNGNSKDCSRPAHQHHSFGSSNWTACCCYAERVRGAKDKLAVSKSSAVTGFLRVDIASA